MRYKSANVLLTNECNLKCSYCYLDKKEPFNNLELHELERVFEYLIENDVSNILWSGGEPTLNRNFIEIMMQAKALDFESWIITNGMLMDEELIKSVMPYVTGFNISIDGVGLKHDLIRERTGLFDLIDRNIGILNNYDIPFNICSTITKINLEEIKYIVKYGVENNCKTFVINAVSDQTGKMILSEKELSEIRRQIIEMIEEYNYHITIKTNIMNADELSINKPAICESIKDSIWINYDLKVSNHPNFSNSKKILDKNYLEFDKKSIEIVVDKIIKMEKNFFNFDYEFEKLLFMKG